MNTVDSEWEIENVDVEATALLEWRAPYDAFCRDVAALQDVDVHDPVVMAEVLQRLDRMGRLFEDHLGWGWDENTYQRVIGLTLRDADTLLSMFRDACARLDRVDGVDFMATTPALTACCALAACMAKVMAQV